MATPSSGNSLFLSGDERADCVVTAQYRYIPRTPPISVSAAATDGNSWSSVSHSAHSALNLLPPSSLSMTMTPLTAAHPRLAINPEPQTAPRCIPIAIQVRKARIFIVAACLVGALVWCVHILERGIVIARGNSKYNDYEALATKADQLNFYFGTAASLIAQPFQILAAMVFPVVVLIFVTENSMLNDSYWRIVAILFAQGCFIAVLTNAFSTTYVDSPGPIVLQRNIIAADLFTQPSAASSSSSLINGTVPLRSSLDTMLRTAMVAPYVRSNEPKCFRISPIPKALTASFGFYTNPWLQYVATNGIKQSASLNVSISDWLPESEARTSNKSNVKLPFNIVTAANLAIHAMRFIGSRLNMAIRSGSEINMFEVFIQRARKAQEDKRNGTDSLLRALALFVQDCLAPQSQFGFSFDPTRAKIQFSRLALDSTWLSFHAITLELPFQRRLIQRRVVPANYGVEDDTTFDPSVEGDLEDANGDLVYQLSTEQDCGARGCWLEQPSNSKEDKSLWTYSPEVVVHSRCRVTEDAIGDDVEQFTTCYFEDKFTNSIVVGALGTTLTADSMVVYEATGIVPEAGTVWITNLTNLHRTLTVSLGFLRWRVRDLAGLLDAECLIEGDETMCDGIYFPLTNGEVLLADAKHLIARELSSVFGIDDGRAIVSIVSNMDGGVFLPLRNVAQFKATQPMPSPYTTAPAPTAEDEAPWPCSKDMEFITDSIEANHWYIDHGLQEAYTAGLFHLFQFGVNHSVLTPIQARKNTMQTALALRGNVLGFEFVARIPQLSATLSQVTGAFFLVAVAVVVVGAGSRRCALTDVHRIARVHLVDQFFPKLLLKCVVLDTPEGQPLAPFTIAAMTLRRRTSDGDIILTLPSSSLTPDHQV